MLDWYLANFFFISISLVESIVGNLALEQFKTKSTNKQKCTLEDKLGGFLISRDTQNKVAKEKESRQSNSDQQEEATLVVPISDTATKQKKGLETNI